VSEVVALGVDHVTLSDNSMTVFIHASKTDQLGLGAVVKVHGSNESMILIKSLQYYLSVSSAISRVSYLYHLDTKPLTQYQFSAMLKKSPKNFNIEAQALKTHSFRIGGATYLHVNGFGDEHIKTLGSLRSAAYKSYIRPL
jgi:site-specific recombinase XerD